MAELTAKNPGKLYGLATVDAFSGDAGARELTRAVSELKLRGVFVESAKGDLLLGAKVFTPGARRRRRHSACRCSCIRRPNPQLHKRFSRSGRIGTPGSHAPPSTAPR